MTEEELTKLTLAYEAYVSTADYPAIRLKAKASGFRKATVAEIAASLQHYSWALDLHSAFGGLWVKKEA